jgi:uncharacterized protein (TIGR02246 family)
MIARRVLVLVVAAAVCPAALPAADPQAGDGKRVKEFVAAFDRGDAKAVAGFWTPTGDYVDPVGKTTTGRAAIEKLYAVVFDKMKGAKLTVTVTSARMVGADVAIEDGVTEVRPADGGPASANRFSAVLARKDGVWYFESVRESTAVEPTHADHFGDLAALVGDWVGEADKGESGTATYAWAENGNFLVSTFATTLNGVPVAGGTQWIGWDAVDKRVRSWTFYSGGGVGEAAWANDGNGWATKVTARTADGKVITGTNRLTRPDADRLTWQMTDLTVNGQPVPTPPPLKLKRVKP